MKDNATENSWKNSENLLLSVEALESNYQALKNSPELLEWTATEIYPRITQEPALLLLPILLLLLLLLLQSMLPWTKNQHQPSDWPWFQKWIWNHSIFFLLDVSHNNLRNYKKPLTNVWIATFQLNCSFSIQSSFNMSFIIRSTI